MNTDCSSRQSSSADKTTSNRIMIFMDFYENKKKLQALNTPPAPPTTYLSKSTCYTSHTINKQTNHSKAANADRT